MKTKKEAGHAHEIEITDEVIEVGLDAITEFLRSMEDAAEGHVPCSHSFHPVGGDESGARTAFGASAIFGFRG
ncbi:hypothetical protein ACCS60_33895 [Rhizobium acaciae]|uniref:hypothetical protein n=1 Tax=Rhizobium acaciae TaxID=2989736 RepID=UPI003F943101